MEINIKFKTLQQAYGEEYAGDAEYNVGKSETVPDQMLSVREILLRFASGTMPPIGASQEYTEDLPDLRGLDISELHEMRRMAKQDIEDIDAEIVRQQTPVEEVIDPIVESPNTESDGN